MICNECQQSSDFNTHLTNINTFSHILIHFSQYRYNFYILSSARLAFTFEEGSEILNQIASRDYLDIFIDLTINAH